MPWTVEVTDTFGGEANYSWVRRYSLPGAPTEIALIRRAKRLAGFSGVPCRTERHADSFSLYPRGMCVAIFVTWDDTPAGEGGAA